MIKKKDQEKENRVLGNMYGTPKLTVVPNNSNTVPTVTVVTISILLCQEEE